MLLAKDVMTKKVYTVSEQATMYEAMCLLMDKGIAVLPVVDKNMRLAGIVTDKDMLQLFVSKGVREDDPVSKYMDRRVFAFEPEDTIVTLAEFFIGKPYRHIVITKNGKVSGILTCGDLISAIVRLQKKPGLK